MRIYVLNCGYLLPDYAHFLDNPEKGEQKFKMPVAPVLIQTEEHNILFDTGGYSNSEGWPYDPLTKFPNFPLYILEGERLEEQLALCGLKPEDVDMVVLSHMDFDHTGGINLFPHADFYVTDPNHVKVLGKRCHAVKDDVILVPGVELLQLPGHCMEHMGMMVHLENTGTMIFTQDAVHTKENYGPPVKLPVKMFVEDEELYVASIEKIRALQIKHNAKLVFGHDDENYSALRHAPEYYD